MIDAACGYIPGQTPPVSDETVLLRCDKCKRTRRTPKDKSDPNGTVEIIATCPDCDKGGTFEDLIYLDKNGKPIVPQ